MILNLILLQVTDTAQAVATAVPEVKEKLSLFALLKEGGLLMIPLLLCSVAMVYIFVERFGAIRKASVIDTNFIFRIREQILAGNLQGAKSQCKSNPSPIARMIEKGVNRIGKPVDSIEKAMETAGKLEVYQLERNMSALNTISRIAPMFGFLGTIAGMIILFFNIQHEGFSLEGIAGGIYTKMVTSAVGLIIGLLSHVAYDYLNAQINKVVNKMETAAAEFIDVLQEPAKN
ncbi:MAG: MotA/TolQ/ExbB proton channel family protein [Chitinophagaceae bacterium]|nr:MotA/TolQ/ExbB proton channel family protein [Chitinophagaceae bacterium]